MGKQKADHNKDENKKQDQADRTTATNNSAELKNCYETQLAEDNDAVSFNFQNDWINGMLYFPMWYRKITPKKRFYSVLLKERRKTNGVRTNITIMVRFFIQFMLR